MSSRGQTKVSKIKLVLEKLEQGIRGYLQKHPPAKTGPIFVLGDEQPEKGGGVPPRASKVHFRPDFQ